MQLAGLQSWLKDWHGCLLAERSRVQAQLVTAVRRLNGLVSFLEKRSLFRFTRAQALLPEVKTGSGKAHKTWTMGAMGPIVVIWLRSRAKRSVTGSKPGRRQI